MPVLSRRYPDLQGCAAEVPADQIKSVQTASDPQEAVHYLILERN